MRKDFSVTAIIGASWSPDAVITDALKMKYPDFGMSFEIFSRNWVE